MTDYRELVKALRCCADTCNIIDECDFEACLYQAELPRCIDKMMRDAAAAIEALLKENKELIEDHPEMVEADGHWEWRKPNGEVLMPKRGEWELIDGAEPMRWGCSRCKYLSWETSNYCPRCGAKMEVQDEA